MSKTGFSNVSTPIPPFPTQEGSSDTAGSALQTFKSTVFKSTALRAALQNPCEIALGVLDTVRALKTAANIRASNTLSSSNTSSSATPNNAVAEPAIEVAKVSSLQRLADAHVPQKSSLKLAKGALTEGALTESSLTEGSLMEGVLPAPARTLVKDRILELDQPLPSLRVAEPPQRTALDAASAQPLYFLSVSYYSAPLLSDLFHSLSANQGDNNTPVGAGGVGNSADKSDIAGFVIVNNSPSDRTVHGFSGQTCAGGRVTVLDAPQNKGFGAGCNLGLDWIYARSPEAIVWIIQPDVELFPDAIATMRQCSHHWPDVSIMGTPILSVDGKWGFSSGQFDRWLGWVRASKKTASDVLGRPMPTRWVSDRSMLLNFATLGHCPHFDEAYFMHYEDCDLCERYFQQGVTIAMAPLPVVQLNPASTFNRYRQSAPLCETLSRLIFVQTHATSFALFVQIALVIVQILMLGFSDRAAAQGQWRGLKRFLERSSTTSNAS
ncbi:MAG: hypothetical protein AAFV90_21230 [Cyanobacteria bacterium J06634_5]